jgi:hypothetical protein
VAAPRETLATLSRHGPDFLTVPADWGNHPHGSRQFHRVAGMESAAPAGFDGPIHPHIPPLDEELGLATGAHQPLKLEELGQLDGGSTVPGGLCDAGHGGVRAVPHGVVWRFMARSASA